MSRRRHGFAHPCFRCLAAIFLSASLVGLVSPAADATTTGTQPTGPDLPETYQGPTGAERHSALLSEVPAEQPRLTASHLLWSNDEISQQIPTEGGAALTLTQRFPVEAKESAGITPRADSEVSSSRVLTIAMRPRHEGISAKHSTAPSNAKYARFTSGGITIEAAPYFSFGVRYLAVIENADAPHTLGFDLELPPETKLLHGENDSALVVERNPGDLDPPIGVILPPVAFNKAGKDVDIAQSISMDSIELKVAHQASSAYPLYLDPTYYAVSCSSSSTTHDAHQYLTNNGFCPYGLTFFQANGYWPTKAQIQGGTFRKVYDRGDCSWFPATGAGWDFQVPCEMHDFGYDLLRVKAPFDYRNVTKREVDNELVIAMNENCDFQTIFAKPSCYTSMATAAYFAYGSVPPIPERPSTWPSTEYLSNRGFLSGTTYWDLIPGSGGSMDYGVYSRSGFSDKFVEFKCNTVQSCRVQQVVPLPWRARGGEVFVASGTFRCDQSGSCPVRLTIRGKRASDGVSETLASNTWSLYNPNKLQWTILETRVTLPQQEYTELQWQFYSESLANNVDVFTPTLRLEDCNGC